jgi:hypothetical protein
MGVWKADHSTRSDQTFQTFERDKAMKHIHADKIMQFAKMVEAGYPIDKLVQIKIWHDRDRFSWAYEYSMPKWDEFSEYRVALDLVEGNAVFEGDHLFCIQSGCELIAEKTIHKDYSMNMRVVNRDKGAPDKWLTNPTYHGIPVLTWNKPESKCRINIPNTSFEEALRELKLEGMAKKLKVDFIADGDKWFVTEIRCAQFGIEEITVRKLIDA